MAEQEQFVRSLEQATLKMIEEVVRNMEKVCLVIETDAKKNVPVDNGILRASITHDVSASTAAIIGTVYTNLDYAPYVEKGTGVYAEDGNGRKTPWNWSNKGSKKWGGRKQWIGSQPHPFLEPARDANKDKISQILAGKSK